MTATDTILGYVQDNPDISTNNAAYVSRLIENAKRLVALKCNLPQFPDAAAQGYSQGATDPTVDLSALTSSGIRVEVDGFGPADVTLTLANCTTGATTAAELQTQIRAVNKPGFAIVTVEYVDGATKYFKITSGTYGPDSRIRVSFNGSNPHVAQAMKLGEMFGGSEVGGAAVDDRLNVVTAQIVAWWYRRWIMKEEVFETPGQDYLNEAFAKMPEELKDALKSLRRPAW